jgi:hypothetical protein
LTVLYQHDDFPNQPFHALIKDIDAEVRTLDFNPSLPSAIADPAAVAKLDADQGVIAAYVHATPALVAMLPAGVADKGW